MVRYDETANLESVQLQGRAVSRGSLGLGYLVRVMGWNVVNATCVNIDLVA